MGKAYRRNYFRNICQAAQCWQITEEEEKCQAEKRRLENLLIQSLEQTTNFYTKVSQLNSELVSIKNTSNKEIKT